MWNGKFLIIIAIALIFRAFVISDAGIVKNKILTNYGYNVDVACENSKDSSTIYIEKDTISDIEKQNIINSLTELYGFILEIK